MFVFERLKVYQKSVQLYLSVSKLQFSQKYQDKALANQIMRSSLSISLNIAEGSGKESKKDRKNFLLISRGSLYETVSILNILKANGSIGEGAHKVMYDLAIEISKMLTAMIYKLSKEIAQPK